MALSVTGPVVTFVVGLLVGGLAIFVGGRIVTGRANYASAVVTALVGAVVWALAEAFLAGIPVVGPILPILAWGWVIKRRYRVGWVDAGVLGFLAWVAAALVLSVLPAPGAEAVGVPFA